MAAEISERMEWRKVQGLKLTPQNILCGWKHLCEANMCKQQGQFKNSLVAIIEQLLSPMGQKAFQIELNESSNTM